MTSLLGLAAADCERIGQGFLAQPVNAISSLVFLGAAVWILARRRRGAPEPVVFALAVGSNAVGGVLLHGLQTPYARWIHDVAILSVLLFVVVFDVGRYRGRPTPVGVYLGSLTALGAALAAPSASYVVYGALGAAIGVLELVEYRHDLSAIRAGGLTARRLARIAALAAVALGATAFFVGRTGGWLCDPGSAFQWHAVWHALGAAAMALYAYAAIEPHPAAAPGI